jgi:hypothetical protein
MEAFIIVIVFVLFMRFLWNVIVDDKEERIDWLEKRVKYPNLYSSGLSEYAERQAERQKYNFLSREEALGNFRTVQADMEAVDKFIKGFGYEWKNSDAGWTKVHPVTKKTKTRRVGKTSKKKK